MLPLTFGSSVLLANTSTMPSWLRAWVKVNPVTHLADAVRALTIGGPAATSVLPWGGLARGEGPRTHPRG
jgi:oleandomycin transport system permease protein